MEKFIKLPVLVFLQLILIQAQAQQFIWANSYSINNTNEVAALTVDAVSNIYTAGVYGASQSLPYIGNCYLQKTTSGGQAAWTKYFSGLVQIGDIAVSDNELLIVGQANGIFNYDGITCGIPVYHMFMMKVDSAGTLLWIRTDDTKNGSGSNLVAGDNGKVAVNFKGISNIGNFIEILDPDGNTIQSKQITAYSAGIVDLAYFNNRVYLNGAFNGPDSLVVDDVVIHLPAMEHAAFVLALDSNFIAEWASVDTTINNRDGRIVAGEDGVYAYFSVLEPPFVIVNVLKKFGFDGQMIQEVEIPFFTTGITLYPDMAIIPGLIGLYVNNDFDFNVHEVILFDANLNLIDEMNVHGPSDLYSGQITGNHEGFCISHVHSGDLNFNNEFTLPYTGIGKRPYISKLSLSEPTGVSLEVSPGDELIFYPNPTDHIIYIELPEFSNGIAGLKIFDLSGKSVFQANLNSGLSGIDVSHLIAGLYIADIELPGKQSIRKKLIVR